MGTLLRAEHLAREMAYINRAIEAKTRADVLWRTGSRPTGRMTARARRAAFAR